MEQAEGPPSLHLFSTPAEWIAAACSHALLFLLAAWTSGCSNSTATYLSAPVPLALTADGGALYGIGSVESGPEFPLVIDTGSPITAYDDGSGRTGSAVRNLRLSSVDTPPIPRLELDAIRLYSTPLFTIGVESGFPIGGVLGGDELKRFSVSINYRPSSSVVLQPTVPTCSCELANDCQAVFNYGALEGGQQTITIDGDLFNYPATRLVLPACLEPLPDPVQADRPCSTNVETESNEERFRPYQQSGTDTRLLLATGFPGLALSASAYDRLRGTGAAEALFESSPARLFLPDLDDQNGGSGLLVGKTQLGDLAHSALALVSQENYFGPCAELARSRRQRRSPPGVPRDDERACLRSRDLYPDDPVLEACGGHDFCDDRSRAAATAAVIELLSTVEVLVLKDVSPILLGINADVRPGEASIEGLIGTTLLSQLASTIDYPGHRFVARCAAPNCLTYPRFAAPGGCANNEICRTQSHTRDAEGGGLLGGVCAPLTP
jgi:hypothetical protein